MSATTVTYGDYVPAQVPRPAIVVTQALSLITFATVAVCLSMFPTLPIQLFTPSNFNPSSTHSSNSEMEQVATIVLVDHCYLRRLLLLRLLHCHSLPRFRPQLHTIDMLGLNLALPHLLHDVQDPHLHLPRRKSLHHSWFQATENEVEALSLELLRNAGSVCHHSHLQLRLSHRFH